MKKRSSTSSSTVGTNENGGSSNEHIYAIGYGQTYFHQLGEINQTRHSLELIGGSSSLSLSQTNHDATQQHEDKRVAIPPIQHPQQQSSLYLLNLVPESIASQKHVDRLKKSNTTTTETSTVTTNATIGAETTTATNGTETTITTTTRSILNNHYQYKQRTPDKQTDKIQSSQQREISNYSEYAYDVQQVVCGTTHTAVLSRDGDVFTMGTLHGDACKVPIPVEIRLPLKVTQLAHGNRHVLALLENGSVVVSWGAGHFGQLGLAFPASSSGSGAQHSICSSKHPKIIERLLPQQSGAGRILHIAAGSYHSGAIAEDGRVFTWGFNRRQQCGIGNNHRGSRNPSSPSRHSYSAKESTVTISLPTPIDMSNVLMMDQCKFVQLSFGKSHSLARTQWGGVYAWGASYACPPTPPSPLSTPISTPIHQPLSHSLSSSSEKLPLSPSRLVGAAFSSFRRKASNAAAAVTTNNNNTSTNNANSRNYNSNSNISSPTSITRSFQPFLTQILDLASGDKHCLALGKDLLSEKKVIYSWGHNGDGQCGVGHTTSIVAWNGNPQPQLIKDLDFVHVAAVSATLKKKNAVVVVAAERKAKNATMEKIPTSIPEKNMIDDDGKSNNTVTPTKTLAIDTSFAKSGPTNETSSSGSGDDDKVNSDTTNDSMNHLTTEEIVLQTAAAAATIPEIASIYASGNSSAALSNTGHLYTWGFVNPLHLGHDIAAELPLVEPMIGKSNSNTHVRLRDTKSFDSDLNLLLPKRVHICGDAKVLNVAMGPSNMICCVCSSIAKGKSKHHHYDENVNYDGNKGISSKNLNDQHNNDSESHDSCSNSVTFHANVALTENMEENIITNENDNDDAPPKTLFEIEMMQQLQYECESNSSMKSLSQKEERHEEETETQSFDKTTTVVPNNRNECDNNNRNQMMDNDENVEVVCRLSSDAPHTILPMSRTSDAIVVPYHAPKMINKTQPKTNNEIDKESVNEKTEKVQKKEMEVGSNNSDHKEEVVALTLEASLENLPSHSLDDIENAPSAVSAVNDDLSTVYYSVAEGCKKDASVITKQSLKTIGTTRPDSTKNKKKKRSSLLRGLGMKKIESFKKKNQNNNKPE